MKNRRESRLTSLAYLNLPQKFSSCRTDRGLWAFSSTGSLFVTSSHSCPMSIMMFSRDCQCSGPPLPTRPSALPNMPTG